MIVPGESIVEEESEDSEDSVAGESTDSSSPPIKLFTKSTSGPPTHTRSDGKAKKTKDGEAFYKGWKGDGVVYLPGDINGLAKKLQLLAA